MLPGDVGRARLCALEEIRMVAALAKLHDDVQETGTVCPAGDCLEIFLEKGRIVLSLHVRHADLQDGLLLGWERLLHVTLETSEQEGAENLVKLLNDLCFSFFAAVPTNLEPFIEFLRGGEDFRQQKVEQRP